MSNLIKAILESLIPVAIFALIIFIIETGVIMDWYYIVSIVLTAAGILVGVWKIVNNAFEKRDREIKQLLLSEQEFRDYKGHSESVFMAFSKQANTTENRLNSTLDRIDRKLDRQDEAISKHDAALAKLDERTKKQSY